MSTPAVVWLVVALLTTTVVAAMVVGLIRHLIVLFRSVSRFGREVSPLAQEIAERAERASARTRPPVDGRPESRGPRR
ncbi:MAG: hypothetical protein L0206_26150 [Actinobacteria bacterium]|nr:hypothetical protein [Actinomycetota bacterium]